MTLPSAKSFTKKTPSKVAITQPRPTSSNMTAPNRATPNRPPLKAFENNRLSTVKKSSIYRQESAGKVSNSRQELVGRKSTQH